MTDDRNQPQYDAREVTETQRIPIRTEVSPLESSQVRGYNYRLPSLKQGSRLLFIGDSITDMNWGRDETDRNHYLGHSYVFLLAARLGVDLPDRRLDVFNRGISGNTVADLRRRWQSDVIDMKPDLLSILIGTNDAGQGVSLDAFKADYRYILEISRQVNPGLQLVLLDPFVLQTGKLQDDEAYGVHRSLTDGFGCVVEQLARDFDAVHVKTQEAFDRVAGEEGAEHWLWDGVHPLPQGHELIARSWLRSVSARWPEA